MDWKNILIKLRQLKEHFDRSYKCLNTDRTTKDETVEKHIKILLDTFEQIRIIVNVNHSRLTQPHKFAAESFFSDVRDRLANVLSRKGTEIKLLVTFHEKLTYSPEYNPNTMPQSVTEFLGLASKLLPDFDGTPENLQSFLDALSLVDSIKDSHNEVAINLIKTKLKGSARNLISQETTLQEIITNLQ